MAWYQILALLLGMLVFFMALGMPVVFAFFAVNLIGAWVFMGGEIGVMQLVRNAAESVQSFALMPIPLFIFMGEIMFHTGVAGRAIDAVDRVIARVPGRLSLVAITGGTIFSSLSGSTIPALILAALFFVYVIVRCSLNPRLAPPYDVAHMSLKERLLPFAKYVLP